MSIFYRIDKNLQYYPTPEHLLRDVASNLQIEKDNILFLEPSAGDGAICRFVKDKFERKKLTIHCIEKDLTLANSLKGQGFQVIHDDFNTFKSMPMYDLIIMNPPFKQGAEHVLKAYECLNGGGVLLAIINAETIKNDFCKDRQLLKNLIERVGVYETLSGAFARAERQTDVEIAVVYLKKPIFENEFDFFGKLKDEVKTNEEIIAEKFKDKIESTGLMQFDSIDSAISMYRTIMEKMFSLVDVIQESMNVFDYLKKECEFFKITPAIFLKHFIENPSVESKEFVTRNIRQVIWAYIFDNTNCKEYIYSKQKSGFYDQLRTGSVDIAFTRENILMFLEDMFLKREEFFKSGVENLFQELTSRHYGTTTHREGWKTNKNWKINKKVIIDWGAISFDTYVGDKSGRYKLSNWSGANWIDDLDRLVRHIDKRLNNFSYQYGQINSILNNTFEKIGYIKPGQKYDNTAETPYFYLKFWKKGTIHIIFKDDKILEEMNLIGANLRRDLGYEY